MFCINIEHSRVHLNCNGIKMEILFRFHLIFIFFYLQKGQNSDSKSFSTPAFFDGIHK